MGDDFWSGLTIVLCSGCGTLKTLGQVASWLERLSDFDFEVEHCLGQMHGSADGLSRLPWDEGASVWVERAPP